MRGTAVPAAAEGPSAVRPVGGIGVGEHGFLESRLIRLVVALGPG